MTSDPAISASALLAAPLHDFGMLDADPRLPPDQAGVYAWWFRRAPTGISMERTRSRDELHLLYVGIAPQRPSAAKRPRTLRRRLRDHVRGAVARSTLRRSLACLLADDLRLSFGRSASGKLTLLEDGEAALSRWMADSAAVCWITASEPWTIEDTLIRSGPRLPLNIRGSRDPDAPELRRIRRAYAGGD